MFYGGLTGFGGGGIFPAPSLDCLGAYFDGSNDYMQYTSAPWTGAQDSKLVVLSFWLNVGEDGTNQRYYIGTDSSLNQNIGCMRKTTDDAYKFFTLRVDASTPGVQVFYAANDSITDAAGWQHCLMSCDAAGAQQLYINDTSMSLTSENDSDENMDLTSSDKETIGAKWDGGTKYLGDMAEFFIDHAEALDISVEGNRRKFIDAAGKPVDLGADGSTPLGSQPVAYFSLRPGDAASDFATNRGSGENMSITGALTLSSSNPSD